MLNPGHDPIGELLGVPSLHRGEVMGIIGLANRGAGYPRSFVDDL